jgi:hypothetical protein
VTSYPDTSFLVRVYLTQAESHKALLIMRNLREAIPFTPLHRHELRNAIRLAVYRKEIDTPRRHAALEDIESDLNDGILAHVAVPWTDAFREAEQLGKAHCETVGVRGVDLLHVGLALVLRADEFLTFDVRQAALAKAAGLRVRP